MIGFLSPGLWMVLFVSSLQRWPYPRPPPPAVCLFGCRWIPQTVCLPDVFPYKNLFIITIFFPLSLVEKTCSYRCQGTGQDYVGGGRRDIMAPLKGKGLM